MVEVELVVDAKGLSCPMPLVKTSQSIKKVSVGSVIEVPATDPVSKEDIPRWAKRMGHEVVGLSEDGGVIRIFIRRVK